MYKVSAKTVLVGTRTTPARKELYQEQAAKEGMRLSEWLRSLAEKRVRAARKENAFADMAA